MPYPVHRESVCGGAGLYLNVCDHVRAEVALVGPPVAPLSGRRNDPARLLISCSLQRVHITFRKDTCLLAAQ